MTEGTGALQELERECAEGRTAPRVSLDDIKANIAHVDYFSGFEALASCGEAGLPGEARLRDTLNLLTICLVVLNNGFTIIGKSAPADARNFDPELGRKLAYDDAIRQVWPLMGYELRQRLYTESMRATQVDEDGVVISRSQDGSAAPVMRT